MPDDVEVETTDTDQEDTEVESEQESDDTEDDALAKLKTALAAERLARKDEARKRKAAEQALADKDKPAEEAALEAARREAAQQAQSKANERIVRAELRAAAADKVTNLDALTRLTDMASIEVDDDGEPSAADIDDAITRFLADFPEFGKQTSKFSHSADQGAKGRSAAPKQLSDTDLESMSPEQINQARREGRLDRLLGRTPQR